MSVVRQFQTAGAGVSPNASTTRSGQLGDCLASVATTTESQTQLTVRAAGTYSQFYTRNKTVASNTLTIHFRKNTANGNGTVAFTATGEFTDETHTDAVVAADLVNSQYTSGASTQASITAVGVSFSATTSTVKRLGGYLNINVSSAVATFQYPGTGTSATRADAQFTVRQTATLQNGQLNLSGNTCTASTMVIEIGGSAGNTSISIGSSATGTFEDTTHTDSVSTGNLVDYKFNPGSSANFVSRQLSIEALSTDGSWEFLGGNTGGVTQNLNVTAFLMITGDGASNATEANTNVLTDTAFTLGRARISVKTNTVSASSTFTSRKNSGAGNQTTTITSSGTGLFEDTTHTDALVSTDEINYSLVTGNAGTSLIYTSFGSTATQTAAGTSIHHKVTQ